MYNTTHVASPRWADPEVTGKLIGDDRRRRQWLDLVHGLQQASEYGGGPLKGWLFHGTDGDAAKRILAEGLRTSYAEVFAYGAWVKTAGVHFGSANVAAFFAEDRIESLEDPELDLVIFGAPLHRLAQCGPFAADGQMLDVPLYSRIRTPEEDVFKRWETSSQDWQASLDILETVVVLADVPPTDLICFRSVADLKNFTRPQTRPRPRF